MELIIVIRVSELHAVDLDAGVLGFDLIGVQYLSVVGLSVSYHYPILGFLLGLLIHAVM